MFLFGIEHEVAFLNKAGKFADFSNISLVDFQQIIATLPENEGEELYRDSYGIKGKKWYIEGMERFDEQGNFRYLTPKGIEIRTGVHDNITDCIKELAESYKMLCETAERFDLTPFQTSFHPFLSSFEPEPPLNAYEKAFYKLHLAREFPHIYMLSYGPDLNISVAGWSKEKNVDFGKKLIYYSPYIIPFSFSPCFYQGKIWKGKSIRSFFRNGDRQAVRIYVETAAEMMNINPNPIKIAHSPSEIGRIEFKTLDACADFSIYASLLALLKGLALDNTLRKRAFLPSKYWHKVAARHGFESKRIVLGAEKIVFAAETALANDAERELLMPLFNLIEKYKS